MKSSSALAVDSAPAAENAARPDAGRTVDADLYPAGRDRQRAAELSGENRNEVGASGDEVEVAVRILGERGHQVLVVVAADADGADRDTLFDQRAAELAEFGGRGGADIGLAVRQEDEPPHAARIVPGLAEFVRGERHTGKQRGAASGRNRADDRRKLPLRTFGNPGRRDQHSGGVVVDDQRKEVVFAELLQRVLRRLPGVDDLSAAHRAGTVEGDREVDGLDQSRLPRRRRCRNRDADHRFLRVSGRENGVFGFDRQGDAAGSRGGHRWLRRIARRAGEQAGGSEAEQGEHSFHQILSFFLR